MDIASGSSLANTGGQPRNSDPLAYRLDHASAVSGLSRSTLYRHAQSGRLKMLKVGGRRLVDAESLRQLLCGTPLSCTRFRWTAICPTGDRHGEVQHGREQS
jgi:excisionase family DNA binding protein